ncbi:MAG: Maf family protein [Butyrivibrio sp.]|nr:Maf family protein [Butyrivibrio sp.]
MRVILASGSPRRKELLGSIYENFEIIPAEGEEKITSNKPSEVVEELSFQKAQEIFKRNLISNEESLIVIGADTVVSYKEKILGKPKDRDDALNMIKMLQGNIHQVYTGVSVIYTDGKDEKHFTFSECTDVSVFPMTDEEINCYVDTGDGYDKAGAYGIQSKFGRFVSGIHGDYNNVVGLPIARLYHELSKRCLFLV